MEKIKHNRFSKVLVLLMAVMMVLTMMPNGMGGGTTLAWAAGEENPITAYVSISRNGEFVTAKEDATVGKVAYAPVTVTDQNQSGTFDIDDVLYAAHEAFYAGGATAGYATVWHKCS